MTRPLHESTKLIEVTGAPADKPNRKHIQIITPGWGSSGYYSADVLERAATDKVIPAGTHMYLNHASEPEQVDRPERDVEKIAAVLAEDAQWDGTRLFASADIMGTHAELIEALAPYIGVSISGSATDVTIGEAEGRTGPIVEGLAHVASVDFVTHAGRGGMVLLESARPSLVNARAMANGISEATANDIREALSQALRDLYGVGEGTYVWVRDFDATTVWFEVESNTDAGLYGQPYTEADGAVTITGERAEVRAVTTYVPVNPAGPSTITESQGGTMPQIEEARLRQLEQDAGRVTVLESERDTAVSERDTAQAERDELREAANVGTAHRVVTEAATAARVNLDEWQLVGLAARPPLADNGRVDEAALRTRADEAVAKIAERANGAGTVTGFGATAPDGGQGISEADFDATFSPKGA